MGTEGEARLKGPDREKIKRKKKKEVRVPERERE